MPPLCPNPGTLMNCNELIQNIPVDYNCAILLEEVTLTSDYIRVKYTGATLPAKGKILFTGRNCGRTSTAGTQTLNYGCRCGQSPVHITQPCNCDGCLIDPTKMESIFYTCIQNLGNQEYELSGLIRGMTTCSDGVGDASYRKVHPLGSEVLVGVRDCTWDYLVQQCNGVMPDADFQVKLCTALGNLTNNGDAVTGVTQLVGADCRTYTAGDPFPPPGDIISHSIFADDCISAYTCGDFCISWNAPANAATYTIKEGSTVISSGQVDNFIVIPVIGNIARTFTITPYNMVGIAGNTYTINFTDIGCCPTIFTVTTSQMNRIAGIPCSYANLPRPLGLVIPACLGIGEGCWGACNTRYSQATICTASGNYTATLRIGVSTQPQNSGAVWKFMVYVDGVFNTNIMNTPLTPSTVFFGPTTVPVATTPGTHTLEIYTTQVSGVPGYPQTEIYYRLPTITYQAV